MGPLDRTRALSLVVTLALALAISPCAGFEPPVPWSQHGSAVATVLQVPSALAESLLPEEVQADPQFAVKSSMGGSTTTGSFYLASYDDSSSVTYNELIVSSGKITFAPAAGATEAVEKKDTSTVTGNLRGGSRPSSSYSGGWLSNVYVDDQNALEAGKEVWGIDKKMAVFNRTLAEDGVTRTVRVTDPDSAALIVAVTYLESPGKAFPMSSDQTTLSVSLDGTNQVLYSVTGEDFRVQVVDSGILFDVPAESPLYGLLGQGGVDSGVTVASTSLLNNCTMDMEAPSVAGQVAT